ncbi:MAG: hypothetical protein WBK55_01245 [Alphaproteobacteria bacterium]
MTIVDTYLVTLAPDDGCDPKEPTYGASRQQLVEFISGRGENGMLSYKANRVFINTSDPELAPELRLERFILAVQFQGIYKEKNHMAPGLS